MTVRWTPRAEATFTVIPIYVRVPAGQPVDDPWTLCGKPWPVRIMPRPTVFQTGHRFSDIDFLDLHAFALILPAFHAVVASH